MITQYACNKPASWPLNIRFSAAKTRFTQSKSRMLHLLHCVVLVTFAREKKEREPLFKQTLKVTFHIITSLWVVFDLSTLISSLACLPRARPFSLSPATSKRLLRRLYERGHCSITLKWNYPFAKTLRKMNDKNRTYIFLFYFFS